ncbi:MAG: hypothetical protein IKE43_10650 [Coriobacteriales bacterium]|nr:hypothetical protein [Coriobacteriales bacterium]
MLKEIDLEELDHIAGGVLTEEDKALCWEKAKRLKIVMSLEDFKERGTEGEVKDYIISIWDQIEVPATLYTVKE